MQNKHLITRASAMLIALIFLISCNKKDDLANHNPVSKKLRKIKFTETDSTLFTYTTTRQLHKVIYGSGAPAYTFLYDPSNRIAEISSTTGVKHKFIYENNRLRLAENYLGLNKVSESVFDYTGDKITTNTLYIRFDSANGVTVYRPSFRINYTYNSNGDATRITAYQKQVNGHQFYKYTEKLIEEYDNAKNPLAELSYLSLLTIYDIQGSKNILKEKTYDALGNIEETTVHTFQYDNAKNPVSGISTITPTGGTPFTISRTYYYK
jgi:hypothetical protein